MGHCIRHGCPHLTAPRHDGPLVQPAHSDRQAVSSVRADRISGGEEANAAAGGFSFMTMDGQAVTEATGPLSLLQ